MTEKNKYKQLEGAHFSLATSDGELLRYDEIFNSHLNDLEKGHAALRKQTSKSVHQHDYTTEDENKRFYINMLDIIDTCSLCPSLPEHVQTGIFWDLMRLQSQNNKQLSIDETEVAFNNSFYSVTLNADTIIPYSSWSLNLSSSVFQIANTKTNLS
ncbi:hypothetical protein SPOG_03602 [Schizosaccharomyces cryophilus OY26]|uniref:Uncharacterized protein n=1 Tax=Schizosaccharomyces cryophilus (strain OY26 / ATCC MYA-4695 / CBS 11777 / NBRC 106824 / NRRL Y48691) TaxID=653667 RepID=S9VZH9_SCHCR|nr:uncharacterized protein SPOG_03602 [Schizosaccharomyces cryophilus OY26]EPY53048.1 hypothetical protein SPOG_03602 [Schizosaccharomyces cryophilus OY26]